MIDETPQRTRILLTFLALPLLTGLTGCGGGGTPLAAPPVAALHFAGTSSEDIWAFSWDLAAAHWDGAAWTKVSEGPLQPRGAPLVLLGETLAERRFGELVLGPGRILVVDAQGVFALDASGQVAEDFGLPAALSGVSFTWGRVVTNGASHFASAKVHTNPESTHLFRYEDGAWEDLQAPLEVKDFRVSADGRVYARTWALGPGLVSILYADGGWSEIEHGPELPFFGETPAIAGAIDLDYRPELQMQVEWLDGDTWRRTEFEAGKYSKNEVFLSFNPVFLEGAPAVLYSRRRLSGSDRFIEYGYLKLNDDLMSFDARLPLVESENVCSTACLGDYEDRTTFLWTLTDGSAVFGMSAKPGDEGASNSYLLVAP